MNPLLTIFIPGIRTHRWEEMYEQIKNSCKNFSYEVFFVGPKLPPSSLVDKEDVRFLLDKGTPSVGIQSAVQLARGEYFLWLVDDGQVQEDSIDVALSCLLNNTPDKDVVFVRYVEVENGVAKEDPRFMEAHYHQDLRLPLVEKNWLIAPVILTSVKRFKELGGLSCEFEHLNMNVIDFCFRNQKDGGKVLRPDKLVLKCELQRKRSTSNNAVIGAFFDNDLPLFKKLYSSGEVDIEIDFDNWKQQHPVWQRKKKIIEAGQYLIGDNEGTI